MREFADVYVEDFDDRRRLQQRGALFFIPTARPRCEDKKLTIARLVSTTVVEREKNYGFAGKQVIQTVFGCRQPVSWESAVGFIRLANFVLNGRDRFTTEDMVACVFRLTQPDTAAKLGISASEIARMIGSPEVVVESALEGYRVSFHDAASIIAALEAKEGGKDFVPVDQKLPKNLDVLIAADSDEEGGPLAVKRLKGVGTKGRPIYVYSRGPLLKPTPKTGHPWAIGA